MQGGSTGSLVLARERAFQVAKGTSPAVLAAASVEFGKSIGERTFSPVLTILVAVTGVGVFKTIVHIVVVIIIVVGGVGGVGSKT